MKSLDSVIFKNSIRRDERIGKTTREKVLSVISFEIVFVFLAVIMIATSIYVTVKLDEIDQTYAFVNILLLMNFLILFTKSIFESLNVLYFSKDLKTLLRMPIKPISILHSKLQNMIISEYPMEIVMLAIPMIVYGIFTKVRYFILSVYDWNFACFTSNSYYDNFFDYCYHYEIYKFNEK